MANYTPDASVLLGDTYGSPTAGETPTAITPAGGGDFIALIGRETVLWFVTTGTGSTVTFDSVKPSDQGSDENVTATLPATGVRRVAFDASDTRFKQTSAPIGYLGLTYTSVVGLTIYAWYHA